MACGALQFLVRVGGGPIALLPEVYMRGCSSFSSFSLSPPMRGDGGLFEHSFMGASISDAAFRSLDVRVPKYMYVFSEQSLLLRVLTCIV